MDGISNTNLCCKIEKIKKKKTWNLRFQKRFQTDLYVLSWGVNKLHEEGYIRSTILLISKIDMIPLKNSFVCVGGAL